MDMCSITVCVCRKLHAFHGVCTMQDITLSTVLNFLAFPHLSTRMRNSLSIYILYFVSWWERTTLELTSGTQQDYRHHFQHRPSRTGNKYTAWSTKIYFYSNNSFSIQQKILYVCMHAMPELCAVTNR